MQLVHMPKIGKGLRQWLSLAHKTHLPFVRVIIGPNDGGGPIDIGTTSANRKACLVKGTSLLVGHRVRSQSLPRSKEQWVGGPPSPGRNSMAGGLGSSKPSGIRKPSSSIKGVSRSSKGATSPSEGAASSMTRLLRGHLLVGGNQIVGFYNHIPLKVRVRVLIR